MIKYGYFSTTLKVQPEQASIVTLLAIKNHFFEFKSAWLISEQNIYSDPNKIKIGVHLINSEKMVGLQVITSDAHVLGEVKGARIDTKAWEVKYLNIKLSDKAADRLGMKKRFGSSTISIPVSLVQAFGELVTISRTMEGLETAKEIIEYKE